MDTSLSHGDRLRHRFLMHSVLEALKHSVRESAISRTRVIGSLTGQWPGGCGKNRKASADGALAMRVVE